MNFLCRDGKQSEYVGDALLSVIAGYELSSNARPTPSESFPVPNDIVDPVKISLTSRKASKRMKSPLIRRRTVRGYGGLMEGQQNGYESSTENFSGVGRQCKSFWLKP